MPSFVYEGIPEIIQVLSGPNDLHPSTRTKKGAKLSCGIALIFGSTTKFFGFHQNICVRKIRLDFVGLRTRD
jgi:hypothetical protein